MDPNQQNQTQNQSAGAQIQKTHKSIGPTIGILIIILIIILGGLYFWGQRVSKTRIEIPIGSDSQTSELPSQSGSDEISSIEADLNAANFDALGSEINSIEAEAQ